MPDTPQTARASDAKPKPSTEGTQVCTLDYVAKMLGEDPELLEAIVYNDDNLNHGAIVSACTGSDDTITAMIDDAALAARIKAQSLR